MAVPDWSDLHPDLLEQVAIKLLEIEDFTAFRGVCSSWREAVAEIKDKFVYKVPQLMFKDEEGWGLYSWRKRKVLSRIAGPGKRCISVGYGWILEVVEEEEEDEVSLVNSRSCAKIKLPNSTPIMNAVLSANPSENPDFMVIMEKVDILGFWRNGDTKWSMTEGTNEFYMDICYCKHKLYAIDPTGKLWIENGIDPNYKKTAEWRIELGYGPKYLVESSKGELLLIQWKHDSKVSPCSLKIFRIDIEKRESVQSLDGDAIFIDGSSAVSVAAADIPGIVRPNCIYFPDDRKGKPPCMKIYSVEHKSVDYVGLDSFSPQGTLEWLL